MGSWGLYIYIYIMRNVLHDVMPSDGISWHVMLYDDATKKHVAPTRRDLMRLQGEVPRFTEIAISGRTFHLVNSMVHGECNLD